MSVSISRGNIKMGNLSSVSLPSIKTCGNVPCAIDCYAHKIERLRPNVRKAYENNYMIYKNDPDTYWREVEAAIMVSRFFRWHVSGDMPDRKYLRKMVELADRNKHCEMLCFTKRYDYVNEFIEEGNTIPKNLHMIFSGWKGLEMKNPHNLPEAHVRLKDGSTTARSSAEPCLRYQGNCAKCAATEGGCWVLGPGEQVVFDKH